MSILALIWPRRTRCPDCGALHTAAGGTRDRVQYRTCPHCGRVAKIYAIAAHVDRGGDQSEVEPLPLVSTGRETREMSS